MGRAGRQGGQVRKKSKMMRDLSSCLQGFWRNLVVNTEETILTAAPMQGNEDRKREQVTWPHHVQGGLNATQASLLTVTTSKAHTRKQEQIPCCQLIENVHPRLSFAFLSLSDKQRDRACSQPQDSSLD